MVADEPSSFLLKMFSTALNRPTGAGKGGIEVPEWAQLFLSDNVFDCFEWAHWTMQSQHRCLQMGQAFSSQECF
jgi:hypothetical protein